MAVLSCYQCRGAVADNAAACPHCGAPLAREELDIPSPDLSGEEGQAPSDE